MQKTWKALLSAGLATSIGLVCLARSQEPAPTAKQVPIMVTPADIKWVDAPPSLPAGAKMFVLEGDMQKPGPFTVRVKFPADYKVPPHFHDADERVTVLSGALHVAMGDAFDPAKAKELPTGGFSLLPAKSHHFVFTKAETTIQLHAVGPWTITYVNPADDPRTKK